MFDDRMGRYRTLLAKVMTCAQPIGSRQGRTRRLAILETRLVEKFTGGITGEGAATHLRLERPDGSGTLICYERTIGYIDGQEGSFLLDAKGALGPGPVVHGQWEVVDGSGTGGLGRIGGSAKFSARRDKNSPTGWRASTSLTYWLEPSPPA
jgi:Protein of unknown function (DUF3224)